jgi:hypothetical protein
MATKKIETSRERLSTFVIHYSPLKDRRHYLANKLAKEFEAIWITENSIQELKFDWREYGNESEILKVPISRIAMDLGINSRSIIKPRVVSYLEGHVYRLISNSVKSRRNLNLGALPNLKELPNNLLEVTSMHLKALELAQVGTSEWILILEDDAILTKEFDSTIQRISNRTLKGPVWINVNSGAGLNRTRFEPRVNNLGLFRVRPPSTRCTTAYMLNRRYVTEAVEVFIAEGVPNFLPIDVVFQIMNRAIRAKAFWSEPSIVIQGSETGDYASQFSDLRKDYGN